MHLFSVEISQHIGLFVFRTFYIFIFSGTTVPISYKYDAKHPWVAGIQVFSNEKPFPSYTCRGDYHYINECLVGFYFTAG